MSSQAGDVESQISSLEGTVGEINLNGLLLPAGSRVTLAAVGPERFTLAIRAPQKSEVAFNLSVSGAVGISARGNAQRMDEVRTFPRARTVSVQGSPEVTLELTSAGGDGLSLRREIPVGSLNFSRVERYFDGTRTLPRVASTILSGSLYLESLNAKVVQLRPAETLNFTAANGTLRSVKLQNSASTAPASSSPLIPPKEPESIGGSADIRRSLMPTLLEWLAARQSLLLFWIASSTVIGIVAQLLKFLRTGL